MAWPSRLQGVREGGALAVLRRRLLLLLLLLPPQGLVLHAACHVMAPPQTIGSRAAAAQSVTAANNRKERWHVPRRTTGCDSGHQPQHQGHINPSAPHAALQRCSGMLDQRCRRGTVLQVRHRIMHARRTRRCHEARYGAQANATYLLLVCRVELHACGLARQHRAEAGAGGQRRRGPGAGLASTASRTQGMGGGFIIPQVCGAFVSH